MNKDFLWLWAKLLGGVLGVIFALIAFAVLIAVIGNFLGAVAMFCIIVLCFIVAFTGIMAWIEFDARDSGVF